MPRVHRIASLLKRWLQGIHQGAVRPQHLDDYLSEFTFRFNRRGSNHRGLLFYRLLEQAIQLEHVPIATITTRRSSYQTTQGVTRVALLTIGCTLL